MRLLNIPKISSWSDNFSKNFQGSIYLATQKISGQTYHILEILRFFLRMTLQLLPVIGLLVSATRERTIWKISRFSDNVFVLAMVVCPCILVYIFYFSVKLQLTNNRIWETIIYESDLTVPEGLQFLRFFTISFCLDSRLKYLCICFLRNFFKCHEIIHFSKLSHIFHIFCLCGNHS